MPPLGRELPNPYLADAGSTVPSKRLRRRVVGFSVVLLLITGVGAYANWRQHRPDRTATQIAAPPAPAPFVPAPSRGNPIDPGAAGNAGVRSISAPLGAARDLTLRMLADTARSAVRTAELGDQLYIVSTTDASAAPTVTAKGRTIELSLDRIGKPGTVGVDVRLNKRVDWKLVVAGSAAEHVVDMRAGGLAGLEVSGDAARIILSLPKPDGTLPITMTGGASAVDVHAPAGVPVRIRLGAGARNSSIDGTPQALAKPDADFNPPEWKGAAKRYDVEATNPIDTLSVDRRALG